MDNEVADEVYSMVIGIIKSYPLPDHCSVFQVELAGPYIKVVAEDLARKDTPITLSLSYRDIVTGKGLKE